MNFILKCIKTALLLALLIGGISCQNIKSMKLSKKQEFICGNQSVDSIRIDSIIVYTAIFLKFPLWTPYYYYKDSLFCNYNRLKNQAIAKKQVYKYKATSTLLDSISNELKRNRVFMSIFCDTTGYVANTNISSICKINKGGEISDLFEIYFKNKMVKIGAASDHNGICYFENIYYEFRKKNKLFKLLYQYRNSAL